MSQEESCCLTDLVRDECHTNRFRMKKCFHKIANLPEEDVQNLISRVPTLKNFGSSSICDYHYRAYIKYYTGLKKCFDPRNKHSKPIILNLHKVTLELSQNLLKHCNIRVPSGQNLCHTCISEFKKEILECEEKLKYCIDPYSRHRDNQQIVTNLSQLTEELVLYLRNEKELNYTVSHKICSKCNIQLQSQISEFNKVQSELAVDLDSDENIGKESESESLTYKTESSSLDYISYSQHKRKFDIILETLDIPPFKRQKMNDQNVIKSGMTILQTAVNRVQEAFEGSNNVKLPDVSNLDNMIDESSWFQTMISNLQTKFNNPSTTYSEKISLMTVLPQEWSMNKINQYFKCTQHMYRESRKIRENQGVLGVPIKKTYYRISSDVREEIEQFYLDDDNSMLCSGIKEFITVKESDQVSRIVQKRLILHDLKDLYQKWLRETKSDNIPCLAFFVSLKPKQCLSAGKPGTHNICVCAIHQNIKLKLAGLRSDVNYKELIESGVCSIDNEKCMLNECLKCPGKDSMTSFLRSGNDVEGTKIVKYMQWSQDDKEGSLKRVTLEEKSEPFNIILGNLIDEVIGMKRHHFIAYQQSEYYAIARKNIEKDVGILTMDFAENYSFIAQNSTQGYYFNNTAATLFTAVLYSTDPISNDIKKQSFCVISDSGIHQAYSVHAFLQPVIEEMKQKFPWIKRLKYFSDGAPTQFKNKNHFINICHHEKDFGIIIDSYNFFATSHGKSACDGIGAVAKRTARRAALQGHQIMTAEQMYSYLYKHESNISYHYIAHNIVEERKRMLADRFESAKGVPNTRNYHYYQPVDEETLKVKLYSNHNKSSLIKIIKCDPKSKKYSAVQRKG